MSIASLAPFHDNIRLYWHENNKYNFCHQETACLPVLWHVWCSQCLFMITQCWRWLVEVAQLLHREHPKSNPLALHIIRPCSIASQQRNKLKHTYMALAINQPHICSPWHPSHHLMSIHHVHTSCLLGHEKTRKCVFKYLLPVNKQKNNNNHCPDWNTRQPMGMIPILPCASSSASFKKDTSPCETKHEYKVNQAKKRGGVYWSPW